MLHLHEGPVQGLTTERIQLENNVQHIIQTHDLLTMSHKPYRFSITNSLRILPDYQQKGLGCLITVLVVVQEL